MYRNKFLDHLKFEKRYSEHTIQAYETDLKQFQKYLEDDYEFSDIHEAKFAMVRSWTAYLIEDGLSARSVNRKISTLKSFYKYLKRLGVIEINPMQKIVAPKMRKRLPEFVEEHRMDMLLNQVEFSDDYEGGRDKMILELLYATGMRVSELVNLKADDVNFQSNTLKVLGKRNKERLIPFSIELKSLIKNYLAIREREIKTKRAPFLLLTKDGEKLRREFVYRMTNSYLGMVTTANKKSPHVLRHTFATHMLNNGADLNSIKEILGHANLSATQVYTHNTIEKLKSIHNLAHPREKS